MFHALLKGLTLGLLLSISVGPVIFSIIKQSLNNGHKGGFAFVAGVSASDIALVLVSNVFTELFSSLNTYRTEIGIGGSIFLITMGVFFLFFKKVKVNAEGQQVFKFRRSGLYKDRVIRFFYEHFKPGGVPFLAYIFNCIY